MMSAAYSAAWQLAPSSSVSASVGMASEHAHSALRFSPRCIDRCSSALAACSAAHVRPWPMRRIETNAGTPPASRIESL